MSSFTAPLTVTAVAGRPRGWRRLLPPGWQRPSWRTARAFSYAVGGLARPSAVIVVPRGFVFDGASVPLPLRAFVPAAHPDYIQAAALHDWMLADEHPRDEADRVFAEALAVLGMPAFWRGAMYAGVRLGAAWAWLRGELRDICGGPLP
jgi:hypothetical protein